MLELLAIGFLILVLMRAKVKHNVLKGPKRGIPYVRRSTSYAARQGRKYAHGDRKTDYSGDDWGW